MKRAKTKVKIKLLLFTAAVILILYSGLMLLDRRVIPAAEEVSVNYSCTYINQKIDEITSRITAEKNIVQTDFYDITFNDNEISSVIINSLLVNEICSKTAAELSAELNNTDVKKITLPLGLVTGFKILSNYGPKINVRLVPMGAAEADYETELTSTGINGVNYKVYINIKTSVNIISPLCNKPLEITRKYMLADVIFTGTVPNVYFSR